MSRLTQTLTYTHACADTHTHAYTRFMHRHPRRNLHTCRCLHAHRPGWAGEGPRDYINTKLQKKTDKEKERERKGKERETKPMHPHRERSFGIYTQI